jgi:uncharacterized protein YjiS (DUF1127 family)
MATTLNHSPSLTDLALPVRALERIGAWFSAWRSRAEVLRELNALEERDLHDLGIARCDFPAIAAGTYRRG